MAGELAAGVHRQRDAHAMADGAGRDTPPQIDAEAAQAALAMGIPAREVRAARAARRVEPLAIWPECWRPVCIASGMHTQWRMGPGGAIGWDYTALPIVESRLLEPGPVDREEAAEEFSMVRLIEAELLTIMQEAKKNG